MACTRLNPQRMIRLTDNLMARTNMRIRTIKHSSNVETDPFLAVDKLNGSKPISNISTHWKPSTSIPTTGSPSQSSAIDSHPSTSLHDLHPLPSTTSQSLDTNPNPEIPISDDLSDGTINWSSSFSGLSQKPFPRDTSDILMAPIDPMDVEIKPDGVIYLPEIKYRRILNRAFGPGGWGLAPRGSSHITAKNVSREYGLVCLGRLVSIARGEQDYYNGMDNIPTATEGCKSNALMRCCKDLGIASELWDPNYVQWWKNKFASVEWIANTGLSNGKKKSVWKKKKLDNWTPFSGLN